MGAEASSQNVRLQDPIFPMARPGTIWFRSQARKAKKLALTACMRKLLTILNSMLKSGTQWQVAASQQA